MNEHIKDIGRFILVVIAASAVAYVLSFGIDLLLKRI